MSLFKKFSALLCGFCALCGIIELLRKYMTFEFSEEEMALGATEKIKLFLSPDASDEPRHFAIFVCLLLFSLLVSLLFFRLPAVSLFASSLPFFHSIVLFSKDRLGDFPFFFILCLSTGFAASIYDSIIFDTEKKLTVTHHAAAAFGLLLGIFTKLIPSLAKKYEHLTKILSSDAVGEPKAVADSVEVFGIDLFFVTPEEQIDFMGTLFVLIILSVILSYLLRGAYFIDLILSAYILTTVLANYHAGVLVRSVAPIIALSVIYFALRLAIFFAEPEPKPIIKNLISKFKKEKITAED